MTIDRITIIAEPRNITVSHQARSPSSAEYSKLGELKEQIGDIVEAEVELLSDSDLRSAPMDGLIILLPRHLFTLEESINECSEELRATLFDRLILLDVARSIPFELLQEYGAVGAVRGLDLDYWWRLRDRVSLTKQKMHGLTEVALEMNAEIQRERGSYCQFRGKQYETLPNLLIRYWKTYLDLFRKADSSNY